MVETVEPITREEVRQLMASHYRPEALGALARQVRTWRRLAGLGYSFAVIGFLSTVVLAFLPKLVPYPIVYDPDGRIIWHGEAATTREERFIDVGLLEWIHHMRAIPSDEAVFHEYRAMAQAMVYGKAAQKFAVYNKETIAAYKDQQRRVFVKIDRHAMTVTRKGASQVWIGWHETWTPEYGYGSETHRFEAVLDYTWYAQPPGFTLAKARLNPRRLYVTDFSWDEVRQEAR